MKSIYITALHVIFKNLFAIAAKKVSFFLRMNVSSPVHLDILTMLMDIAFPVVLNAKNAIHMITVQNAK